MASAGNSMWGKVLKAFPVMFAMGCGCVVRDCLLEELGFNLPERVECGRVWGGGQSSERTFGWSVRTETCSLVLGAHSSVTLEATDALRLVICSSHTYFLSICWALGAVPEL